jgi:hypothetical protein
MKSRSGGFNGEGCGEADDSRMMVLPTTISKKRLSKGFLENFHSFVSLEEERCF